MRETTLKRAFAILLAVVMCVTITTTATGVRAEENPEAQKYVLVFGDSTSSGYGLPDYSFTHNSFDVNNNDLTAWKYEDAIAQGKGRISVDSHPWQTKQYIADKEFAGDLGAVNLSSMCLGGMRTDELRALLDNDYYERVRAHEMEKTYVEGHGIGFLSDHMRDYVGALNGGGATVDGHPVNTLADAQAYTRAEVAKADVIVVDVCTNNFGTYMARRIAGTMRTSGFEEAVNYHNEKFEDVEGISDETKAQIRKLKNQLIGALGKAEEGSAFDEFIEGLLFCYACCITNFTADVEELRQINPDAKLIIVGIFNSLQGIKLDIDGQIVDFGVAGNLVFNTVNSYIRALDKNSNNYYFADISGGLETFVDDMAKAESLDSFLATDDGANLMSRLYNSFRDSFLGGAQLDEVRARRVQQLLFDTAKWDHADLKRMIANLSDPSAIQAEMQAYIAGDSDKLSEDASTLLHLYERFLLDTGVGQHPSRTGCLQKAAAVQKAYDNDLHAYDQTKAEIAAMLGQLKDMLEGTAAADSIDEMLALIGKIQAALPMIDEAQAAMDGIQALREQFADYFGQTLDLLGLTAEDLAAGGEWVSENVDFRQIAGYIRTIDSLIRSFPAEDEIREMLEEKLAQVQEIVNEKAAEISNILYERISKINEKLREMAGGRDYDEIVEDLKPIYGQLKEIGKAVMNLPEYEKALKAYIETVDALGQAAAELQDEVATLKMQVAKLTANLIDVELKAAVSFPAKSVRVDLGWAFDEDAAGYILKVDGQEVIFTETESGLVYEHTGVQIGQTYKYEVTPYILFMDGDGMTPVYGRTFTRSVTPKVKLAKAKLTKVKAAKKAFTVKWKKVKGADGYQLSYKTGKKTKKVFITGASGVSKKIKKLESRKKYTVKVRACKTVNGRKYYGKWSAAKKVTVK